MRIRTRTKTLYTNLGYGRVFTRVWTAGTFPNSKTETTSVSSALLTERSESMSDLVFHKPEVFVDPVTLKWKRVKRLPSIYRPNLSADGKRFARVVGKNGKILLPVKPCTHTATVTGFQTPAAVVVKYGSTTGVGAFERVDTLTYTFQNHAALIKKIIGTQDVHALIQSSEQCYTAGDFVQPDWFELNSQFREKLEQFSDSNFLLGETMAENAIFVDAFKILVNPSNAIKVLLKHLGRNPTGSFLAKHQREKFKRMKFGQFSRSVKELAKKSVDFDLFYKFGVKPAIEDVKSVLRAHSNVSSRMQYLRNHGGSWVPVRVRDELVSPVVNAPPASTYGTDSSTTCFVTMLDKKSMATIGAWARVRDDLNWSDDWSAYLQYFGINKMVGLAWELIPCSFIVDWFTDTQEILNNQTRLRTGGPFTSIKGTCASLKTTSRKELRLNPGRSPSEGYRIIEPSEQIVIATQVSKTYSRSASIPETSGVVDFSTLGLFQWATLGELTFKLWPH